MRAAAERPPHGLPHDAGETQQARSAPEGSSPGAGWLGAPWIPGCRSGLLKCSAAARRSSACCAAPLALIAAARLEVEDTIASMASFEANSACLRPCFPALLSRSLRSWRFAAFVPIDFSRGGGRLPAPPAVDPLPLPLVPTRAAVSGSAAAPLHFSRARNSSQHGCQFSGILRARRSSSGLPAFPEPLLSSGPSLRLCIHSPRNTALELRASRNPHGGFP